MHIAATDPRYIRREDVTAEDLERRRIFTVLRLRLRVSRPR